MIFLLPIKIEYILERKHTVSEWAYTGALVLHLSDDLLVFLAKKEVVFWIVACVVELVQAVFHVFVNIARFYFKEQAVCVCVKQITARAVPQLEVIIVEVVHQRLT